MILDELFERAKRCEEKGAKVFVDPKEIFEVAGAYLDKCCEITRLKSGSEYRDKQCKACHTKTMAEKEDKRMKYTHKWVENIVLSDGKEVLVREDPIVCEICGKSRKEANSDDEECT